MSLFHIMGNNIGVPGKCHLESIARNWLSVREATSLGLTVDLAGRYSMNSFSGGKRYRTRTYSEVWICI